MTSREVYEALKEEICRLRLDLRQWLEGLDCRLNEAEKALVRIEERERVEHSYKAPWYRAVVQAIVAGLVGAVAAVVSLIAGFKR
jgi:hypothetical protein